jgi:hypothetical protein
LKTIGYFRIGDPIPDDAKYISSIEDDMVTTLATPRAFRMLHLYEYKIVEPKNNVVPLLKPNPNEPKDLA